MSDRVTAVVPVLDSRLKEGAVAGVGLRDGGRTGLVGRHDEALELLRVMMSSSGAEASGVRVADGVLIPAGVRRVVARDLWRQRLYAGPLFNIELKEPEDGTVRGEAERKRALTNARKSAFMRIENGLAKRKLIGRVGEWVWAV